MSSDDLLERLSAPFPPDAISWRVGPMSRDKTKGKALAYIDARDVMARLDAVCGVVGWQAEYVGMPNGSTCCRIGIWAGSDRGWVWKSNGAVNLADSDKAESREMAEKGSYSDAFKRAAVLWGIGRYLYEIDAPFVAVNQYKQIEDSELPRLRALLTRGQSRPAAKPQPVQAKKNGDATEHMRARSRELVALLNACENEWQVDQFQNEHEAEIATWPPAASRSMAEKISARRVAIAEREAA